MAGGQLLVVLEGRVQVARVAVVAEEVEVGEEVERVRVVLEGRLLEQLDRAQERAADGRLGMLVRGRRRRGARRDSFGKVAKQVTNDARRVAFSPMR